jgi:hypothetical protein
MNKWLSAVAVALLMVVAGLAWGSAVQSGNPEMPVMTAQGSRPQPPLPPLPPPTQRSAR